MPISDTETPAISLRGRREAATGKRATPAPTNGTDPPTPQRSEPAVEIERTLQIDPARGVSRIGIEALEGLLAEIGADDALTLRLSLNEAAPVLVGLALARAEAEREVTLSSALDLATALINTERRA